MITVLDDGCAITENGDILVSPNGDVDFVVLYDHLDSIKKQEEESKEEPGDEVDKMSRLGRRLCLGVLFASVIVGGKLGAVDYALWQLVGLYWTLVICMFKWIEE